MLTMAEAVTSKAFGDDDDMSPTAIRSITSEGCMAKTFMFQCWLSRPIITLTDQLTFVENSVEVFIVWSAIWFFTATSFSHGDLNALISFLAATWFIIAISFLNATWIRYLISYRDLNRCRDLILVAKVFYYDKLVVVHLVATLRSQQPSFFIEVLWLFSFSHVSMYIFKWLLLAVYDSCPSIIRSS